MVKLQKNVNSIENNKSGNSVNHLKTLISKELIYKHPTENSKPETEANLETRKQNTLLQVSGLSLRARGRGFSPATKRVAPGYFYWKIEEK